MSIKVRWTLGIVVACSILFALCVPRWRLASREMREFEKQERLLRAVAERIDRAVDDAVTKGNTAEAEELSELAAKYRRHADRRVKSRNEWATARWLPFLPHPYIEVDSPLRSEGID